MSKVPMLLIWILLCQATLLHQVSFLFNTYQKRKKLQKTKQSEENYSQLGEKGNFPVQMNVQPIISISCLCNELHHFTVPLPGCTVSLSKIQCSCVLLCLSGEVKEEYVRIFSALYLKETVLHFYTVKTGYEVVFSIPHVVGRKIYLENISLTNPNQINQLLLWISNLRKNRQAEIGPHIQNCLPYNEETSHILTLQNMSQQSGAIWKFTHSFLKSFYFHFLQNY